MQVLTVSRSRYPFSTAGQTKKGKISKQERHAVILFVIGMCIFGGFTFSFLIASKSAPFLSIFNAPDQLVVKNDMVGIHSSTEGEKNYLDAIFFDLVSLKQIESFSFHSESMMVSIYNGEEKLCNLSYYEGIYDLGSMLKGSEKSFGIRFLNNQNSDEILDPTETVQFYLFLGQDVNFQEYSHLQILLESPDHVFELDFKVPLLNNDGFSIIE